VNERLPEGKINVAAGLIFASAAVVPARWRINAAWIVAGGAAAGRMAGML